LSVTGAPMPVLIKLEVRSWIIPPISSGNMKALQRFKLFKKMLSQFGIDRDYYKKSA